MPNTYLIFAVLIASFVTLLLRFLPFLIFGENRKTPELIVYIGRMLPGAVMAMLVVYCLKDTNLLVVSNLVPRLLALLIVVGSYVWKRNTLLSIVAGTICYMAFVQLVF